MSLRFLSVVAVACAALSIPSFTGPGLSYAGTPVSGGLGLGSPQGAPLATPLPSTLLARACLPRGARCEVAAQCCKGLACIGAYKGDTLYRCRR